MIAKAIQAFNATPPENIPPHVPGPRRDCQRLDEPEDPDPLVASEMFLATET